jgi:type IV pilus assembly protein PilC
MSVTCRALSTYYEKRDRLAQAIRSSLLYPLAMMVMIFIVVVMLLTQAMPIFDQVFAQFGFELGGLALAFLNVGTWLRGTAFWLSGCMVVLIIIGFVLTRLPAGRRFFAWLFEHNPLTGELSFRLSVSRLMLGMAAMLKSGMTPQSAIELAIDLVDDSRVKQRLEVLDKKIVEGMSFQVGLTQSGLIPKDSYLLIAIGFRTGSNAEAFAQIGENITASTERQMILLAAAIEPTLVALMTVLVGIILLSVMLPLLGVLASI